jgi:hypothetical protein
VETGLTPSDRVVVNGLQRVRAGAPVTPKPVSLAVTDADFQSSPDPAG